MKDWLWTQTVILISYIDTVLTEEQIKAHHDFFARRYNIDIWKIFTKSQQDWVDDSGVMMRDEAKA